MYNRSEGVPLTGLFHPWAQWDLGLDTLENSSRHAAVVAPPPGGTPPPPARPPERARPSCMGLQESLRLED